MKFILDLIFRLRHSKHDIIKSKVGDAKVILEIGSHLGTDTVKLRESFPEATIFCFEPDPRSRSLFSKYHKDLDVFLFPVAISDESRDNVDFFLAYSKETEGQAIEKFSWIDKKEVIENKISNCSSSSLKTGHSALINSEKIKVEVMKLDDWAMKNRVDNIDLIWMDVQGAEKEVFNGAQNILNNTRYIWAEYGEKEYDGGLSWTETRKQLKSSFRTVNFESVFRKKGDIFLENKREM